MNTKNSLKIKGKVVFIIPTLTNIAGLSTLLTLLERYFPKTPAVIVNNDVYPLENKIDQPLRNNIYIINNKKNLGFAKSTNIGAKKAVELYDPKYFVFLNDDVIFDYDWVSPCINKMVNSDWIATTPLLYKVGNKIENSGYKVLPHGKVELIKDSAFSGEVDGLTAAALVIEVKTFIQIGGFDERFFAYLEDVDLFLRLKKRGYLFGVTKEAAVIHIGQVTSSHFKSKRAYFNLRNWIYLILKNWETKKLVKNLPGILLERCRNLSGLIKSFFK